MTDPVTAGSAFGDRRAAYRAALGEAVERYSGEIVRPSALRLASYDELRSDGANALDPESMVLFSDRQYATPGFPFVPMARDLRIRWVPGRCLTRDEPAWLPASLTYPNWYTGPFADDPHTNNPFYPGIAAGTDLDSAIAAGLQEVIERHATMVWWANAHRLDGLVPDAAMTALWQGEPTRQGQRAWLVHLDNEFGVPVVAGMVESRRDAIFAMGFAARPTVEAAALKAWAEALTLQDGARDLQDPAGGYRRAVSAGTVNGGFVKPWRADRAYLDDYRPDFRDAVDLMCQLQLHLDPRALDRIRSWVDVEPVRPLSDVPPLADGSRRTYQDLVEARGYEIYVADLTTPDVAPTGMRVVRVLVPGLVPNFAAAFPFHGHGVLRTAATRLGWRSSPLAEDEVNVFPMAHA